MSDERAIARMRDMLAFARDAIELLGDADAERLAGDKMRFYAVTRAVEMIGEAATGVDREIQEHYPTVPWSAAIGTRHRLIHGYTDVNPERLVQTVRESLPDLINILEQVLGS